MKPKTIPERARAEICARKKKRPRGARKIKRSTSNMANSGAVRFPAPMRYCVECFNVMYPTAKTNEGGRLQLAWCCRYERCSGKHLVQ